MSWTYWLSAGKFQRRRGDRKIPESGKATRPPTASPGANVTASAHSTVSLSLHSP